MKIPRYLINFNLKEIPVENTDFLIVGSGVAGLFSANFASSKGRVIILTKGKIFCSNTQYAQGGIAASSSSEDTWQKHLSDTISAGDGLVNKKVAEIVVKEAKEVICDLVDLGVKFDRENNHFSLGWEAAHSERRILHAQGDKTGEVVEKALINNLKNKKNIKVKEHGFCVDILTKDERCIGAIYFDELTKKIKAILSKVLILSTGGAGRLYKYTTNPRVATGDGVALAYRCGAKLQDLEFFQFHPTALYIPSHKVYSTTRLFLISEAVRGEGAILKNTEGERFMKKYSPQEELAPRDIVSRAIVSEMKKTHSPFVYLDLREIGKKKIKERFPTIYSTCKKHSVDITQDMVPVVPAAHYFIGGVKTNIFGETTISRLFAVGEVASTSLHGANRLASNSIIEALVFAKRSINYAQKYIGVNEDKMNLNLKNFHQEKLTGKIPLSKLSKKLRENMWENLGIIRNYGGLKKNHLLLKDLLPYLGQETLEEGFFEFQNKIILSHLITKSALLRTESRGAHFREDFPKKDKKWKKHIIIGSSGHLSGQSN